MSTRVSRRAFALTGAAAGFHALTSRKAFALPSEERRIAVHAAVEIGTVRPELHGHFAEHLGTCTYGGMWVGPNSPIPNIEGYRKQTVEYLRQLGVSVLRWPGGCYADDYHWREGIGPAARRPKRVNLWWGNTVEDNGFGTHEFIGFCRLIGAQPYFAGNLGSGTPQEMRDWVEYCNQPSGSALAQERAANGSPAPFGVRYWGVGNENWGCGGNMTPEEYCAGYRRFATFLRKFGDTAPYLIACGPSSNDVNWTRRFFDVLGTRIAPQGFAMHFYSGGKDTPTKFTVENMRLQLSSFARFEQAVIQQRAILDGYDPQRKIGLLVDEWGVWDRSDPEVFARYGLHWQQNTIRSAVAAALGLNLFHRQADKLVMCNIAQIVNVLHSVLLTGDDKCFRTPTYHAFDLLKPHRGKVAVRVENADTDPLGLSVSCSRQAGELVLSCVNPRHDTALNVLADLASVHPASATARILQSDDYNAPNTFEAPDRIVPVDHPVSIEGAKLKFALPPLSVATVMVRLA